MRRRLALLACLAPGALAAQEPPPPAAVLPDIEVTARREPEPLQRVPFSVTPVDGATLRERDLRDVQSLTRLVPSLGFVDAGTPAFSYRLIRGVGAFNPFAPDDTSVPVYVDGVPLPSRAADLRFPDAARVEVLRGPQGTLFGRNAQAGAINIVSIAPTPTPQGSALAEFGSYFGRRVETAWTGPVAERLGIAAALDYRGTDGDLRNELRSGRNARGEDGYGFAGRVVRESPGGATRLSVALRARDEYRRLPAYIWRDAPDYPTQSTEIDNDWRRNYVGGVLTVEHDFGPARLISLTGLQRVRSVFTDDFTEGTWFSAFTGFPRGRFVDPGRNDRRQREAETLATQEVRLAGTARSGADWQVGVNLLRSEFELDFARWNQFVADGRRDNRFATTSVGVFGEVSQPFLSDDRLRLIAGLRYTRDSVDYRGRFQAIPGNPPTVAAFGENRSVSDDLLTGRAGLAFDLLPRRLTLFGTVARGQKSAGFDLTPDGQVQGRPAEAYPTASTLAYEVGLRGTVPELRGRFSLALFRNDTTDEHVRGIDAATLTTRTTALDTRSQGVEAEAAFDPLPNVTLTGFLAATDAEITGVPEAAARGGARRGAPVPYVPRLSGGLGAEWRLPAPAGLPGEVSLAGWWRHVGARTVDPSGDFRLSSYDLVDLRAAWRHGPVEVFALARNAFDARYELSGIDFGQTRAGGPLNLVIPGLRAFYGAGARVVF